GMYVSGWDRSEYSVKTCKGVPDDDPNARGTLRDIVTSNTNGQIAVMGPGDRQWVASLIIMVPRLSAVDLQTRNGPMALHDFAGNIHVRASNVPVSLDNVVVCVLAFTPSAHI